MTRRSRLRATLVGLLALFLVPVVIFANPAQAAAATVYGAAKPLEFSIGGGLQGLTCKFNAFYVVGDSVEGVQLNDGRCDWGWMFDAAGEANDGSYVDFSLRGVTPTGGTCSYSRKSYFTSDTVVEDGLATRDWIGTFVPGCVVTELCVSAKRVDDLMPDVAIGQSCKAFEMGAQPVQSGGTCTYGRATGANGSLWPNNLSPTGYFGTSATVWFGNGGAAGQWIIQPVWRNPNGVQASTLLSANNPGPQVNVASSGTVGTGNYANATFLGVQITYNTSTHQSLLGTHNPVNCQFYYGTKIRDDGVAGSGTDEPGGALTPGGPSSQPPSSTTPPVTTPEPPADSGACNFSVTSPSTWLEGGMCSLVGLVGRLISAVLGLPAAIVSGIGALFIPEAGAISDEVESIGAAWEDSAPGKYVAAFDGVTDAAKVTASGCGGPVVQVPTVLGSGSVTMRPLSACAEPAKTVAAIASAGISLFLYASGALVALRVLAASLGLNLNGFGRTGEGSSS